jgi:hypothetical protein
MKGNKYFLDGYYESLSELFSGKKYPTHLSCDFLYVMQLHLIR